MKELPRGWTWEKLGNVCSFSQGIQVDIQNQYHEKGKGLVRFLRIIDFTQGDEPERYIHHPGDKYILKKDEIAMVRYGTVGFVCIGKEGVIANNLFKITPNEILDKKYLINFLISSLFTGQLKTKGATMQALSFGMINPIPIPIAPIAIQQAIVFKIEELFSELDKGIENLRLAQQQLKTYRQSVLKWAFEGKLTNENMKEGELPEGWKIVELKDVCEIKRGKSKHRPRNEPSLYGGKYPFIQTGDVRESSGKYITEYTQTYSELGLQQSKLWPKGTLCITIAANIGETAILGFDACFPDSVVGLLSNENTLLTKYTNYYFISFKQKLEELAPATAQKNINVDILEKVQIPLAPIKEQESLIEEIETRLSVADKMEESISQSLQQAEALRQSILKKGFEGKLTTD